MMQICIEKRDNERAPLGGHRHLPSWLLRYQVCTPTQCIGPISVSVPKKRRKMMQICIEKRHNDRAPSCVKKMQIKNKMTTAWPKAKKKLEFALQFQVFHGLRPRGGQIILLN